MEPSEGALAKEILADIEHARGAMGDFGATVARVCRALNIDHTELGRQFDMSRLSALRWLAGNAAPHPSLRPHVLNWLESKLTERLEGKGCNVPEL